MKRVNNIAVVSDLHCGCKMGLCHDKEVYLDDGGSYVPSKIQKKIWSLWQTYFYEWLPMACHNEPFALVVNGDAIDGVHHGSTTQVSQNLEDQSEIAYQVLKPIVDLCEGRFYMIRGTEVHVGKSGVDEERLAKRLGAIPDAEGRHARYELWARIGKGESSGLCHFLHHIGTCGSGHYESTAVLKELAESYTEAGRWRRQPPDVVVRSHRHRHMEVRVPTQRGYGISFTTAAWQLKTAYAYRVAGARLTEPQIGGSLIRCGDKDIYTRHFVRSLERSAEVEI